MSQSPKQSFLAFSSRLGASLKSSLGSKQRVHCGHVPQSSEMNQKQAWTQKYLSEQTIAFS